MSKNLLKIITLFAFLAIPIDLNKNYSPKLERIEYLKTIEKNKKDLENYKKRISEIEEKIVAINRKKEFFLMRIQEKNSSNSITEDYINRLKETEKELKKYHDQKDSLYNLINKTFYLNKY